MNTVGFESAKSSEIIVRPGSGIIVTSPNGSENWQAGSTHTISWTYAGDPGATAKIEFLKGGSIVREIAANTSVGTGGLGLCPWTIPADQTSGEDYRIKITSATASTVTDSRDSNFTISVPASITVNSPNGGETWQIGSQYTIRWRSTVNIGSSIKLELLKGDAVVNTIAGSAVSPTLGNGSFAWTVPKGLAYGSDYRVRVTSNLNGSYTDISDKAFKISGPTLGVTVPDGGESWPKRSQKNITWTHTGDPGGNVKIQLLKAGLLARTITTGTPIGSGGEGSYPWSIPPDLGTRSDYRVKISHNTIKDCTGTSNSNFSITKASLIAAAGPNQTVVDGEQVMLDGSGSFDPDDGIATYRWKQLTGPQVTLSDASDMQPTFIAPETGVNGESLTFQLTVVDQGGLRARDTCLVNVTWVNHPPTAEAEPEIVSRPGALVVLDGSKSRDPDGNIASYRWTQLAGQPVTLSDPGAAQTSFLAPSSDSEVEDLVFQLLVTDAGGLQDKQKVVVRIIGISQAVPKKGK
jgi:hypothetical protein